VSENKMHDCSNHYAEQHSTNCTGNTYIHPITLAVNIIASTLIAGPEYKNAIAGQAQLPFCNTGRTEEETVHEHTARIEPETEPTRKQLTY
jgi:hypothetical protein